MTIISERYTKFIYYLVLAIGVALTLHGLNNLDFNKDYRYTNEGMIKSGFYFVAVLLLVFFGSSFFKKSPLSVGFIISIALALYANALWSLMVVIWIILSSIILGKSILSMALGDGHHSTLDQWLVGMGLFGVSVGLFAHLPYNYPGIYALALIIPLLVWPQSLKAFLNQQLKWFECEYDQPQPVKILDTAIVGVVLIHFVIGLMPEIGHDPLAMHLFIPAQLLLRHQWGFAADTYAWAVMPMLGDWIFSIGYMLGGEFSARLINLGFIFALGLLIRNLVLWAGGSSLGSRWAVLLFLSTPLTFVEGGSVYIESVLTAFAGVGTFALLRSCSPNGNPNHELPIAGFMLGCALSAKVLTLFMLPILLLVLAIRYKMWMKKEHVNAILTGLGLFFVLGIIPYATSFILTGNPVFPFYNGIFKSPLFGAYNFVDARWHLGVSWEMIYDLNFHSTDYMEAFPGVAGFQWLLLLPATSLMILMKWQKNAITLLFVGVVSFLLIFHSTSYLRYVFPLFPFFFSTIGIGISQFDSPLKTLENAIAYACVGLNLIFIHAGPSPYVDFPIEYLSSQSDRESFLRKTLPIRNAVELVNALNAEHRPVGFFAAPFGAGLAADALYANWYNSQFNAMVNAANTEVEFAQVLKKYHIDYLIVDDNWGNEGQRLLLDKLTNTVSRVGNISVRTFLHDSVEGIELLKNSNLESSNNWTMNDGVRFTPDKEFLVSVESFASQRVPVTPNNRYLLSVKFHCSTKPAPGRLQVNWLDGNKQLIKADIRVNDCQVNMTDYSMEVTAPPNASFADVYMAGQSVDPILFKAISFKDD
jgi:hypothetical protein